MKIDYKTKINVKFANGNSMAFLGLCWYRNCNIYMFCNELPINLYLKPIK